MNRAGWLNANRCYYFIGYRFGEAVSRRGGRKILLLWFFCQNPASRKKWIAGAASHDRRGQKLMQRWEALEAKDEKRPRRHLYAWDFLIGVQDLTRQGALRFKFEDANVAEVNAKRRCQLSGPGPIHHDERRAEAHKRRIRQSAERSGNQRAAGCQCTLALENTLSTITPAAIRAMPARPAASSFWSNASQPTAVMRTMPSPDQMA